MKQDCVKNLIRSKHEQERQETASSVATVDAAFTKRISFSKKKQQKLRCLSAFTAKEMYWTA